MVEITQAEKLLNEVVTLRWKCGDQAATIERLRAALQQSRSAVEALKLARNRLQRVALELPHDSLARIECDEWANEATAALSQEQSNDK